MNQVKIRHPIEGDKSGVDAIFTEIEGTLDKDAKDTYALWLKGQREVIFDTEYERPFKALVAEKDEEIVGLVRCPYWKDRKSNWIRLVYVLSKFKGQGIEELLFKEAMQRLKDKRISLIVCDSPPLVPSCVALPSSILQSEGFKMLTRDFMEKSVDLYIEPIALPEGYTVKNWHKDLVDDFAMALHGIWGLPDNIDALFIPEYSTLEDAKESLNKEAEDLDPMTTLLLLHKDRVCGVSTCYVWKKAWEGISDEDLRKMPIGFVGMIGLIQGYRGKGLGELMMRLILKGFADESVKFVRLGITVENVPAYNLYKKLGFKEMGKRSTVYYLKD